MAEHYVSVLVNEIWLKQAPYATANILCDAKLTEFKCILNILVLVCQHDNVNCPTPTCRLVCKQMLDMCPLAEACH